LEAFLVSRVVHTSSGLLIGQLRMYIFKATEEEREAEGINNVVVSGFAFAGTNICSFTKCLLCTSRCQGQRVERQAR
jgi:hypothetical protein